MLFQLIANTNIKYKYKKCRQKLFRVNSINNLAGKIFCLTIVKEFSELNQNIILSTKKPVDNKFMFGKH